MPQRSDIVSLETDRHFRAAIESHTRIHDLMPAPFWNEMLYEHPAWAVDSAHRAILDGDNAVALTSLGLWEQRFGNTSLMAGEIGLVGTLPEHRRRGLSRRLMESWVATMRDRDVPLMFLIGIPDFYEQWDFHYACSDHVNAFLSIAHDPLTACAVREGTARSLNPDTDIDPVLDMIAQEQNTTPCSPVFDADLLRYLVAKSDAHGVDWRVIEDASGDICAVVRWKRWAEGIGPQAMGAVTLAAARDDVARGMLAGALLDHFGDSRQPELSLAIAPHSPFGQWLFLRGARRKSDSSIYPSGYAAMYRINDLVSTLDALRTAWDEPQLVDQHAGATVTLRVGRDDAQVATILVMGDRIELKRGSGGVEIGAPPAVTVPWITGWRSASDWLDRVPYPALPGPAFDAGNPDAVDLMSQALLRNLFPHRHPYIGDTIQGG